MQFLPISPTDPKHAYLSNTNVMAAPARSPRPIGLSNMQSPFINMTYASALRLYQPAIFPPERSRIPSPPMNTPVTPQSSSAQQTLMSAPPSAYPSGGGGSLLGLAGLNGGRENKAQNGQGQEKTRGRPRGMSESIKKRGISPMGERMIKGHFDGFGV